MPQMRARTRPPGPTPAAKKSTAKKAPAKKATAARRAPAKKAPAKKRASAKKASATKSLAKKSPATAVRTSTGVISLGDVSSTGVLSLADVWRARQRAEFINEVAGGVRRAAELLDVAPSQPSRWASGEARPRLDQARLLIDLDHVMSHALLVLATDELVRDWLSTPNAHIDGARPMDWIRLHGTAEVVDALRSEAAGAYA